MLSAAFDLHLFTRARVRRACFRPETRSIIHHTEPVFSKIAYTHIGENKKIRSMLQSEFAQGALLGESQDKLVKRIMKVTGQLEYQARRVAQTERTRVKAPNAKEEQKPTVDPEVQKIIDELDNAGVEYVQVKKLAKARTEDEIIAAIAGGDKTTGSCASAALLTDISGFAQSDAFSEVLAYINTNKDKQKKGGGGSVR